MNRKSLDMGNIIFGVAIIVVLISLISMNNKISALELKEETNNELSWEEVFSDVETSSKADVIELEAKIELIESKLNDLNDKLDKVENDQQELEVLKGEIDDITFFDLPSLQGGLMDVQATLSTIKGIVYSNESYRILVGKAVSKISDNEYEILLEDNTKEIMKMSAGCETYAVGQNAYGKIELEEYIEHLLFYEHENSTLIEIDGEIRFMFQGDVR